MNITIAPEAASRARSARGGFVLLVENADDPNLARTALAAAGRRITSLPGEDAPRGAAYVSTAFSSPQGPFIFIDGKDFSNEQLDALPAVIADELERTGVRSAVVTVPARGGPFHFTSLGRMPNLVLLFAFPHFGGGSWLSDSTIPPEWVKPISAWLRNHHDATEIVTRFLWEVRVDIPTSQLTDVMRTAVDSATDVLTAVGDESRRVDAARIVDLPPQVLVAVGGPSFDQTGLAQAIEELRALALSLPKIGYACVSIDPDWQAVWTGTYSSPSTSDPYLPPESAREFVDELVIDGLHWQLMTEGHKRRIGVLPSGSVDLGDGRWELTVGKPAEWWPDSPWPGREGWSTGDRLPNAKVRREARNLLRPLLATQDDDSYFQSRLEARQPRQPRDS